MTSQDNGNRPEEWNNYWSNHNTTIEKFYDIAAKLYRNLFIRPTLNRFLEKHFSTNSNLLHAGCGGGMVDDNSVQIYNIIAFDHSETAIKKYKQRHRHKNEIAGSITELPFACRTFDGIYNLGVFEHFLPAQHTLIFNEFERTLRPGGKILIFWPPRFGISVIGLAIIHWVMNKILGQNIRLHPPEPSLINSKKRVRSVLENNGFVLVDYYFGYRDLFTQCALFAVRASEAESFKKLDLQLN